MPALALAEAEAEADSGYGYQKPKFYCRDTNTSIYAEVCVPGFKTETTPVELAVKNIVDDQFCYTATRTECEEVSKVNDREICTYTYSSKKATLPASTVQVTFEEKSETMKVTTCRPSGYPKPHGYGHQHEHGEHQYCREEYQTQQYRVPLVNEPLEVSVELAAPEPAKECVTKQIEVNEVQCRDVEEERCIDLAAFEDATVTVDQTAVVLGDPNCKQITLTLPTEVCSKHGYGHH